MRLLPGGQAAPEIAPWTHCARRSRAKVRGCDPPFLAGRKRDMLTTWPFRIASSRPRLALSPGHLLAPCAVACGGLRRVFRRAMSELRVVECANAAVAAV